MKKVHKTKEEWKEQLDPETYRITREAGTEAPFTGEYDNYKLVKEVGNPDDLGYFLDPETLSYAEELRHNPELKAVFDVARDMPKEKLEAIYNVLKQIE